MADKIRIAFTSFPDFSGNAKALYLALKRRNINKFELVWFVKDKQVQEKLKKMDIIAFYDKDDRFLDEFSKAKLIFNTHGEYIELKKENQIFIGLWHGKGPKKSGYALDTIEAKKFINEYSFACNYIVTPSEFLKSVFSYTFNKNDDEILVYPQARYEFLKTSNGKENLSKLLNLDISKYKKIIMYAPTFRNGLGRIDGNLEGENIINLRRYDENELSKYLAENNYLLILKLHPSEESKIELKNNKNIVVLKDEIMLNNFITINEVLNGIDLLIADYSSIYVDYANLLRPILFINTDIEKYKKDRGIMFDSDYLWFPGPKVHKLENTISEIDKLLKDENYFKKEREEFNKLVNGNNELSNDKFIDEVILKLNFDDIYKRRKNENLIIRELELENELIKENIKLLNKDNEYIKNENKDLRKRADKLDAIEGSRSYKLITKIEKIFRRR